MNISLLGIIGALVLVTGAAYPDKSVKHPARSLKNWLLALGGLLMLVYASLNYWLGEGAVFFIFLQGLVNVASVLMLTNAPERFSTPLISGISVLLIMWSFSLFEGGNTLFFIIGLSGIALGYVLKTGTSRRNLALLLGSALIALFSYIESDWIFFWLNVFFAVFSAYYTWTLRKKIG